MANAVTWFQVEELDSRSVCMVGWGSDEAYFWRQQFGTPHEQLYVRVPNVPAFRTEHSPRIGTGWLMRDLSGPATNWVAVPAWVTGMADDKEYAAPVSVEIDRQNIARVIRSGVRDG